MSKRLHTGFTLIEVIIFIVVLGAGLAGILSVFNTSIKNSADPLVRKQTLAIAESLLEEIVQKEFANPPAGFTGPTPRAQFDDVDDYNAYASPSVVDASGTAILGLSAYSIAPAVVVSSVVINGATVKQIVVSVTGPQGVIKLTGYRGNY